MTRRVRTSPSRGSPCAGCGGYAGSWGPGAWALARPDWGGQAGCSWEAAPGCRAGTRPSPVQTFSRCDGSRNLITTKSAGPVRELRSILCDPFQTLARLAGPLKRRPSRPKAPREPQGKGVSSLPWLTSDRVYCRGQLRSFPRFCLGSHTKAIPGIRLGQKGDLESVSLQYPKQMARRA